MEKTYRNKGSRHVCLDGTVVDHNEYITTEEDLITKFPNKFVEVVPPAPPKKPAPVVTVAEAAEEGAAEVAAPPAKKKKVGEEMVDVTEKFPEAVAADLIVKKNKRGWWVFDGDAEPANEKPLRTKKALGKFLEEYLKED